MGCSMTLGLALAVALVLAGVALAACCCCRSRAALFCLSSDRHVSLAWPLAGYSNSGQDLLRHSSLGDAAHNVLQLAIVARASRFHIAPDFAPLAV